MMADLIAGGAARYPWRDFSERLERPAAALLCGSEEGSYLRLIDFCITQL